MSFQIKDFASISAGQINHARAVTQKITDFAPGSVARTLMEGAAVEIEELYLQMFLGLRDAIPVATFLSFGFDKLAPKRAYGFVSVSATPALAQAIAIPAGTVFSTVAGERYTAAEAVTWAAGASLIRVPVIAAVTGLAGNVAAGVITKCDLFPASSGFAVSNALIANGADAETDAEREARFAEFVRSLSGGTVMACLYAAGKAVVLDADGNIDQFVTRTGYVESAGRMRIYLYSNRGVASSQLLANAQTIIDGSRNETTGEVTIGYRAAGVRQDVLPMTERSIAMSIHVAMLDGYTLTAPIRQNLTDVYDSAIRGIASGETLHIETLVELLLSVNGVASIYPVGNSNISCGVSEALIPSTLTITAV